MMSNIDEHEGQKTTIQLMCQLTQGEQAGQEKGWMTIEEVETELNI